MEDQEREAGEYDALSLCDLPMGEHEGDNPIRSPRHARRSTAEELFEFLADFGPEMCSAEDIIVCGKLAPSAVIRRRSESLSEANLGSSTRSDTIPRSSLMRNCRSLDYDKDHHNRPVVSGKRRQSRAARDSKIDERSFSAILARNRSLSSRPRWYIIMFGPVNSDMQGTDRLRDMKSRLLRRSPSNLLFPSPEETDPDGDNAARGSCLKGSSWKFLQLLSCQSRTSVAVGAPCPARDDR